MDDQAAASCAVCAASAAAGPHASQASAAHASGDSNARRAGENGARFAEQSLSYQRTVQLKIFLSYGHDRFQQVAFHLKHALQERGHSVWVDVEKLKAGIDWEDGITGALTWVKEAQHDGRVLLLMTPHALRRPDGYCLNEIARAASNRLSIFPVMVCESEPPPAISMLPFFDLRDCVPTDPDELALDPKSDEWNELMRKWVHSDVFLQKAQRLFAVLELFDAMNAYGVPAVAGVENLGLPAAFDGPHHRDSRAMSLRRLLRTRTSSDSLMSIASSCPSSPMHHQSSFDLGSTNGGSAQNLLSQVNEADGEDEADDSDQSDESVSAAALRARYMFSFDDSCYLLAKRLFDDLTELGFSIYEPPPPPGDLSDQEAVQKNVQAHEDALQWAAADKNGKMILLVTPESVGRPSGVCLNDISAAMAAGMGFVPLMVRQCEIPLSICRIQWLDMSDCFIYNRRQSSIGLEESSSLVSSASINELRYNTRRDQLVTALKGKLDHDGQQARLFSLLSPFSFQLQISQLTQRFTGRGWLFDRIRTWIDAPTANSVSKVFWVTGQIGSGKTSVAAKMVQIIPEIAAFHFALQEDDQTQLARRCVLSLAYQLTTQLPEYAVYLQTGEPLEEIVPVSSVQSLVSHLLVAPLNAIARPKSDKPLILLIDGLEHLASNKDAGRSGGPPMGLTLGGGGRRSYGSSGGSDDCLVSLLPALIARLPSWVRVILLSREEHSILLKLQDFNPSVSLDREEEENKADIRQYVEMALCSPRHSKHHPQHSAVPPSVTPGVLRNRSPSITSITDACKISSEQVELITKRSEGLFLYAVNIVQSVEEGRLSVDQLQSLPLGLGGYLRQFFESHFDDATYKSKIRPVLEVLCAAFEPLTRSMLGSIFNWTKYDEHEMATRFGSLFQVSGDDYVRPFHSSVLEWVRDVRTAGSFLADVASGHERIALWGAREYDDVVQKKHNDFIKLNFELEQSGGTKNKAHIYIVRHLTKHLMRAEGDECMALVGKFAKDDNFQLARRLLSLRSDGMESFFHGDITRERSEELLRRIPVEGSFLIRYSARKKTYCTSFIAKIDPDTGELKFAHNLIHHLKNNTYSVVPPEKVTEKTVVFPDLVSFIDEYQRRGILTTSIPRDSPLNRQISTPC